MCFSTRVSYFSLNSFVSISPIRKPLRPVLSIYVGPIPFKVEPILFLPFAASLAASNNRCDGKIKCALVLISNFDLTSTPNFNKASISFLKITGSITTPFPITLIAVG